MIYDSRPCLMLINYLIMIIISLFFIESEWRNFGFFLGEMGKFVSESVE